MRTTARLLITGRVQGVGYRAWTERTAKHLGLSGWVRNLSDGRVEIWASGRASAVEALAAECRTGPSFARVDDVETKTMAPTSDESEARFAVLASAHTPSDEI